jgi:hypothetical protein
MTPSEQTQIDTQLEDRLLGWVKSRSSEAEQLALDATRLLSCTSDRLESISRQGFFKRIWSRLTGASTANERVNINDLIRVQKNSLRYLNMLQEQEMLMAHSMLSLKNNLLALNIQDKETRNIVDLLAEETQKSFEKLENRVDQLEISSNLQGWLLTLEEREYDEKYPTEFMRLFRIINDFYTIKDDNWNYNDLMFMRKAIRSVKIDSRKIITLNFFIDNLIDEIQDNRVGIDLYNFLISELGPQSIENYSLLVVDNISSPVFISMHRLKTQYTDRLDDINELKEELKISTAEALKRLLRRSISQLNVNLNYEFPLADAAIEILGCIRLANRLFLVPDKTNALPKTNASSAEKIVIQPDKSAMINSKIDPHNLTIGTWSVQNKSYYDYFPKNSYTWNTLDVINVFCPDIPRVFDVKYINNLILAFYHTQYDKFYVSLSGDGYIWNHYRLIDDNNKHITYSDIVDRIIFVFNDKLIIYLKSYNNFYYYSFDNYKFFPNIPSSSTEVITTSDGSNFFINKLYPFDDFNIIIATNIKQSIFISNDLIFWQVIHAPFDVIDLTFDGKKIICNGSDEKYYSLDLY